MGDRRKKQLEIVLKLNKLTQQSKIIWVGSSHLAPALQYTSKFKNRSYFLTDSLFANLGKAIPAAMRSALIPGSEEIPSKGSNFGLFIRDDDEETEIWIPPMPAVDDLARTVHHQITKGDTRDLDEVLKDLEEAENLLEG